MVNLRLWVDDVRDPPNDTWDVARSYDEAVNLLSTRPYVDVSLDHDLGDANGNTGYDVACWIEQAIHAGKLWLPGNLTCHSDNPPGRDRIMSALASAAKIMTDTLEG